MILSGSADPNTGIPASIGGYSKERACGPPFGTFRSIRKIGDQVSRNDLIGDVEGCEVYSQIDGAIRGLIRTGTLVTKGLKIGDIDPRGQMEYCYTISENPGPLPGRFWRP